MLDETLVRLCNKAKEREVRDKKAKDYSRKVRLQNIKYGIIILLMFIGVGIVGNYELDANAKENSKVQAYAKHCIVTKLDHVNDVVVCEDVNGFEWEFKGIEDYDLGDIVALVMDNNGTEIICDDEI
ncbi:MAG: hypothetical protein MJ236_04070, partial [Clostridia bacterium]|nr:hypothetical protein [Clostridia bacterium]